MKNIFTHVLPLLTLLLATACGEDRTWQYEEKTQHNQWMYDVMLDEYLWTEQLAAFEPAWKNYFATPSDFLSMLTKKAGVSDAWSYVEIDTVVADSHERGYFNHQNSYGLDFTLMTDPTGQTTKQVVRVLTVYPDSPAERAGLVRNDFICSFDSYKFSSNNIHRLQKGAAHTLEVCHLAVNEAEGAFYWADTVSVSLPASEYVEDKAFPVYKVVQAGETQVGYLMCNRLVQYPTEQGASRNVSDVYREELDRIMAQMKRSGVTEMVLDLRLCNDGVLSMAQRLASYVVAPQYIGETFVKTYRNEAHASENVTLTYDASVDNLGLNRVYVLTSEYTQGAAEWMIHALRTTMGADNVIIIGQPTKGQNVMTEEVGDQYYVRLFPVVAYVADAAGDYDYGSIEPDVTLDEFSYVSLGGYGETNEILFYTALQDIMGLRQNVNEEATESAE